jgi:ferredoxin, 2Fe-2S
MTTSPFGKPPPATTRVQVLPHPELCPAGLDLELRQGRSLLDELLAHGLAVEHACDKVCACATCHVHLRAGADGVVAATDDEEDQLDDAWGLDAQSRLACCVKVGSDPLVVELPRFTRNHAREIPH